MAGGIVGNHQVLNSPIRARNHALSQNLLGFLYRNNQETISRQIRVATGRRTLRPEDGAAFYAIAKKEEANVRAKGMALDNIGDAKDLLSLAESGLLRIDELLTQMRDILVRAGNDTFTDEQRDDIKEELKQLAMAIDEIVKRTRFNETDLMFTGEFDQTYQVGPGVHDKMRVQLGDFSTAALGIDDLNVGWAEEARESLGKVRQAIFTVKDQLLELGAIQSNLTSLENIVAGSIPPEESIQSLYGDADLAHEQVKLTRLGLLNQLASAQTSAANVLPNAILNVLSG